MHGGDIYRNKVSLDFSVNVNPLGPPQNVMEAMRESLSQVDVYPDPLCRGLREALARRHEVRAEQVITGNGASELIFALCRAVQPEAALLTAPGFSEYERALSLLGADMHFISSDERLDETVRACRPDLVLIANPNNPTGQMFGREELLKAAEECLSYGGIFAVDECFLELSDPGESASLIPEMYALTAKSGGGAAAVLRAFTKSYCIPGIRIGYLIASDPDLSDKIRRQLPDWNCSGPALAAGSACLQTSPEYLTEARRVIQTEREYLMRNLERLGMRAFPSQAGYLLFQCEEVPLYTELLRREILIRDCSDYRGLGKGFYRIAVRNHPENRALIRAMENVIYGN